MLVKPLEFYDDNNMILSQYSFKIQEIWTKMFKFPRFISAALNFNV